MGRGVFKVASVGAYSRTRFFGAFSRTLDKKNTKAHIEILKTALESLNSLLLDNK